MSGYKTSQKQKEQHRVNIIRFLESVNHCDINHIVRKSPVPIPKEPEDQFAAVVEHLFENEAVVELKLAQMEQGKAKASPCGQDFRRHSHEWLKLVRNGSLGALLGDHRGVYMRVNAVNGSGSGSGAWGTTTDSDIATFDLTLIEHDWLKMRPQAHLLSALALPICAITDSGGGSLHALVKVRAADAEQYAREAKELHALLRNNFGFDSTNSNPSRLTRAPGFFRREDGMSHQLQRLLYLNPNPNFKPISEL